MREDFGSPVGIIQKHAHADPASASRLERPRDDASWYAGFQHGTLTLQRLARGVEDEDGVRVGCGRGGRVRVGHEQAERRAQYPAVEAPTSKKGVPDRAEPAPLMRPRPGSPESHELNVSAALGSRAPLAVTTT